MARLYANENFPLAVVEELRGLGHDVLPTNEAGKSGRKIGDPEVLEYACADERGVLTLNRRHFMRLHKERPDHSGIVVCTLDHDLVGQAKRIHAAIEAAGSLATKLIRVYRPNKPKASRRSERKRNST